MAVINIGSGSVKLHLFSTGKTEGVVTLLAGGLSDHSMATKKIANHGASYLGNIRDNNQLTHLAGGCLPNSGAFDDTFDAVASFFCKAKSLGEDIFIFGTEAMRRAGGALAKKIRDKLGVDVEILDGQTEALCGFLGAADGQNHTVVVDVGGASTEISAGKSSTDFCISLPIGSVSLFGHFGVETTEQSKTDEFLQSVFAHIDNAVAAGGFTLKLAESCKNKKVVLIGGSALNLAALSGAQLLQRILQQSDTQAKDNAIATSKLENIIKELFYIPPAQRIQKYPFLEEKRALVLPYGICIIYRILLALSAADASVSQSGLIEGYIKHKNLK